MKNPQATFNHSILLPVLAAVIAMSSVAAYPQACGSEITQDTVLTSDIGPCPSFGLAASGPITVNLNGHTILGEGQGTGIIVEGAVTVTGPGTITGFNVGISFFDGSPGNPSVATRLLLTNNTRGIVLEPGSIITRIIDNRITKGGSGISLVLAGAKIRGNIITKNSGPAISSIDTAFPLNIVNNVVTKNGSGLLVRSPDSSFANVPVIVTANAFSENAGNGATMTGNNITFEANLVERNHGDGIVLSNLQFVEGTGNLVQDNVANGNDGNGISVVNSVAPFANRIVDNESRRNDGVDLFWDGVGTSSCWALNDFATSNPSILPACP